MPYPLTQSKSREAADRIADLLLSLQERDGALLPTTVHGLLRDLADNAFAGGRMAGELAGVVTL